MKRFPSLSEALRRRRRRAAVATHREATEGLQSRPAYDLDPAGRLNRDLDTDLFHAMPHQHLAPIPTTADLLAETTRRIDDLHAAGALDEGSYNVLDHYLDAAHHTMDTAAERHARSQLDFLRRAETNEDRTHHETWETLQNAQTTLQEAQAHLAHARAALSGTPEPAPAAGAQAGEARPAPARTPAPGTAQHHHTTPPTTPQQETTQQHQDPASPTPADQDIPDTAEDTTASTTDHSADGIEAADDTRHHHAA